MRVLTHDHSHSQTSEPKTIAGYITKLPWDCVIRLRCEQRDRSSADPQTFKQNRIRTAVGRHSWPVLRPKLSWSCIHRPLNIIIDKTCNLGHNKWTESSFEIFRMSNPVFIKNLKMFQNCQYKYLKTRTLASIFGHELGVKCTITHQNEHFDIRAIEMVQGLKLGSVRT